MPRLGLVVLGGADGRVKMRVRSVRVLGELRHQLPEDGRFQTTWPGRRGWGRGLPQPLGVGAGGVASCYPCTGSGLGAWPPVTRPRGRADRAGGVASLSRYPCTWPGRRGWGTVEACPHRGLRLARAQSPASTGLSLFWPSLAADGSGAFGHLVG